MLSYLLWEGGKTTVKSLMLRISSQIAFPLVTRPDIMATDLHEVPEATVAITPDLGLHIIMMLANPRAKASIFFFTHRSLASVLLTALIISCLSLHSRDRQMCVHHKCSLEYGCVHALCMELCLFHCNNHVRIYTYRFQF